MRCSCIALVLAGWLGGSWANAEVLTFERGDPENLACGRLAAYAAGIVAGKAISYGEIESQIPLGPNGASLEDIDDCIRRMGLRSYPVRLTASNLGDLRLAIVHAHNHYFVLSTTRDKE